MSLKKKVFSGVFWTTIQQFSTQGINFFVSILLARFLEPEEFGLLAIITIFFSIGTALVDSGLTQSLIRDNECNEDDYSTVFIFNLVGSLLIYLILFLIAPLIADFYKKDILTSLIRVYSIVIILYAFTAVQTTLLIKKFNFKRQLIFSLPSTIINAVSGVTLAYLGYGVWSLVWSAIFGAFISVAVFWYFSKWKPKMVFKKELFKKHFDFGYKLTLTGIVDAIFVNIYSILIGKFFSFSQLGFYNRAFNLQQYPVKNISVILHRVTYPLFSEIQNESERLKLMYKKIMQMCIYVTAPILFIIAALGEPVFTFLFTSKWLPAVPYFQVLCLSGVLYPIHYYNLNLIRVKGRSDLFLRLEIYKKILSLVIISISLFFGIYGLLFGSVIISILMLFVNTKYAAKFINYNMWEQLADIFPTLIIAGFVGFGTYYLNIFLFNLEWNVLVRLIVGGLFGILFYLILSKIFKISALDELIKIRKF
jgi:teichuronic acid exporter